MSALRPSVSPVKLLLPFATLLVSVVALIAGGVFVSSSLSSLQSALNSPTATAADVYSGQSTVTIAAVVLGAGIVALIIALALFSVLAAFGGFNADAATRDLDGDLDDDLADDGFDGTEETAVAAEEPGANETPVAADESADTTAPAAPVRADEPTEAAEPARADEPERPDAKA